MLNGWARIITSILVTANDEQSRKLEYDDMKIRQKSKINCAYTALRNFYGNHEKNDPESGLEKPSTRSGILIPSPAGIKRNKWL
jgi:hypothetical protein